MRFSKILRPILSAGGLLLIFSGAAQAGEHCLDVDSRKGWQGVEVPRVMIRNVTVSGGWTVDGRSYAPVGAEGHTGLSAQKLAPFEQDKYAKHAPFGALLLRLRQNPNQVMDMEAFAMAIEISMELRAPFDARWLEFRINDGDSALADNTGALRVCVVTEG